MSKDNITEVDFKDKYGGKLFNVGVDIEVDDSTTERKEYVFKKPSTFSYDRYVKKCGNNPVSASNDFVKDNIVEEQNERLAADLEEYPALALSLTDKLFAMLGLAKSVDVKKL